MALYQGEFLAATKDVTVKTNSTTSKGISADTDAITEDRTTIWKIGYYDGIPKGFLNADKQLRMHPSDDRMTDWDASSFIVGEDETSAFPMATFKGVNSAMNINFKLTAVPDTDVTARIATTLTVKDRRSWTSFPMGVHLLLRRFEPSFPFSLF